MSGLLMNGRLVDVPGVRVLSPREEEWVYLDGADHQLRDNAWPRQVTLHTTQGTWPHKIVPTAPRAGSRAQQIARYWGLNNGIHGGAHIIVDGTLVACLADLVKVCAYHATSVNQFSIGIEMVQEPDGTIGSDTLDTTVKVVLTICRELGIPLQMDDRPYVNNSVIKRLRYAATARSVVGVFGHRQNAWMEPGWLLPAKRAQWPDGYADRGRGDPGDEIFVRLKRAGAMSLNFDVFEDLTYWKAVQRSHGIGDDGVCGPGTVRALRATGMWSSGIFAEAPILPPRK